MRKYIYIIVCAAFAAALHSCSSEVEGVDDTATAITTHDITVAPFPAFGDVQTRSTDAGSGHDKTSWEDGDVIYIQLNGKDSWYAMKYNGSKWTFQTDFPGIYREDTYKAVYAPNYEPNGSSLVLKDGVQPATAEYLTCEGKKPINISFERQYARIRIYTGGLNGSYKTLFDGAGGFVSDDGFNFQDYSTGYTYTFTPDKYGNSYLYGTWGAYGMYLSAFETNFTNSYLLLGPKCPSGGYTVDKASSPNRSYVIDLTYATLDLDNATKKICDWSPVLNAGITKVKMVGAWNNNHEHLFDADIGDDNVKITSIDLSGVTGMDMPTYFCNGCSNLTEIKLPEDLSIIRYYTFSGCKKLARIELPQNVTEIKAYAFEDCSSLSKVVCYAATPPTLSESAFSENTPSDKVLYVPKGYVETYKNAAAASGSTYTSWNDAFNGNIKSISEMPEDE